MLYPELAVLMPNTPNYKGRFLQGVDTNTKVGDKIEAGLPNIWGDIGGTVDDSYGRANGAFYTQGGFPDGGSTKTGGFVHMDAARCSPIYGRSTTVQPPAVIVKYIIKAE